MNLVGKVKASEITVKFGIEKLCIQIRGMDHVLNGDLQKRVTMFVLFV